jgi:hypothetical protein
MEGPLSAMLLSALLAGCGLGETAVSAAAGGASQVEQAKQAKRTEARVTEELDAAAKVSAERRTAAEAATQ